MKIAALVTLTAGCFALPFLAQQSAAFLPQDRGPDEIDVRAYPRGAQAGYKLFLAKCSRCHTIARAINTTMPCEDWARDVNRMANKPNSGISDGQGKQIIEFLIYDQTHRKDKDPKAFFPALVSEKSGS